MKKMKKIMALVLSFMMVVAMSVATFAGEGGSSNTYTITIDNGSENVKHTYEAYQIFTGTLNEGVLSSIQWGSGVTKAGQTLLGDAAAKAKTLTDASDAAAFAKEVADYLQNPMSSTEVRSPYTISGLTAGYYLVKDANGSLNSEQDSYTSYIMKVVENVTAKPKSDIPSFEKKLKDTNDTTGNTTGWQDSADYDIGDKIPFKLEGTVASNYADYETYYFAFHDIEEESLTFDASTVKVFVDGIVINSGYEVVSNPTDGCTFEVKFADLKKIASVKGGSKITVEYESTLNDKAVLGSQGNVNKAKLEFSNNPNDSQDGANSPKGETPWDNVIVFTYKVVINKVTSNGASLKGAEFKLEKILAGGTTKEVAVVKTNDGTTFTFSGLDDGDYILTETVTPAQYNTISPITFTVNADHTITWDGTNRDAVLTNLTGTKATGEITFTENVADGSLSADVVNNKGSELPTTGGMGTTIFYVVGSILVLGAAILLITKKRMSAR